MSKKFNTISGLISASFGPLFIAALITVSAVNTFNIYKLIANTTQTLRGAPLLFLGNQFAGLDQILPDVQYVGYYTNRDLDESTAATQFAQAQYVMAPIVLDTNYENHRYIIFDCSSEKVAKAKIAEIGAFAIKKNQFGIILAERP